MDNFKVGASSKGLIEIKDVGSVEIDCRISEGHSFSSTTTNYPVEDGSVMTDHIKANPFQVTLEGLVSDTPVTILGILKNKTLGAKPSVNAFELLTRASRERKMVSLHTSLAVYEGVLTSLSITQNGASGKALQFNATFKEIVIATLENGAEVTLEEVSVPEVDAPESPEIDKAKAVDIEGTASRTEELANAGKQQMGFWEEANSIADKIVGAM